MNCSINCESRFGTWEEMLRFLGRKDHGSGRGDVDPKSFTILNMDSLGHHFQVPFLKIWRCFFDASDGVKCLFGSFQPTKWDVLRKGFSNLEMVSAHKGHCPWLVVQTPGTLARSSRATGERARELRKGDIEIWVQELFFLFQVRGRRNIQKALPPSSNPRILAEVYFFLIFKVFAGFCEPRDVSIQYFFLLCTYV